MARARGWTYNVSTLYLAIGGLVAVAFHLGFRLSVGFGVAGLLIVAIACWLGVGRLPSKCVFLRRLFLIIYCAPFVALVLYALDNSTPWWSNPEATAYELSAKPDNNEVVLATALVGLLGLSAGLLSRSRHRRGIAPAPGDETGLVAALPLWCFSAAIMIAWGCSYIAAPSRSILVEKYTAAPGETVAVINFGGAIVVSYTLFVLLWIDAERTGREGQWGTRQVKYGMLFLVITHTVVVLQLMRGSRHCVGLLVALSALWWTRKTANLQRRPRPRRLKIRILPLALAIGLTFALFLIIGEIRGSLADEMRNEVRIGDLLANGMRQSTWTAVALTNLGMAEEYTEGAFSYLWGQTYLDIVASSVPGPLSSVMEWQRPIDSEHGPAWWYHGVSTGGVHIVVVPFKNGGAFLVLAVLCVIGKLIAWLDAGSVTRGFLRRFFFGAAASASFLWFWYGDMSFVRTVQAATVLGLAYLGVVGGRWKVRHVAMRREMRPEF
jgi:hypothetical protein